MAAPADALAEFGHGPVEGEIIVLALAEGLLGPAALLVVELHAAHDRFGLADLLLADPAVRLGQMAHDRKHRREQGLLDFLPFAGPVGPERVEGLYPLHATVQEVADQHADRQADGPADQHAQQADNEFATPTSHQSELSIVIYR